MPRATLTAKKLDRMIWIANRRTRARTTANRSGFGDHTEVLERELVEEMRPFFVTILRAARRGLE